MTKEEKIKDIIHLVIYTGVSTYGEGQLVGNSTLMAANRIARLFEVKDIDLICQLAKGIENCLGLTIDEVEFDMINACIVLMVKEDKMRNILDL